MVIRLTVGFVLWAGILCGGSAFGQAGPKSQMEASQPDTVKAADTLNPLDTSKSARPVERNEPTKALVVKKPRLPNLSILDSLMAHFLSERQNLRRFIDQSIYHDAGDYARHDPSFWADQYHETPVRSVVAPFGLTGAHLDYVHNGRRVEPFEHIIEPDGAIDANDLPTVTDDGVYLLEGPAGQLFGGSQAVASMITRPVKPDSLKATSAFLVDKGAYGFSHARARYAKQFTTGKDVSLSLDYRLADGFPSARRDNTYHYTASFLVPVGEHSGFQGDGWIYDRRGDYPIRPDKFANSIPRYRIDRHLDLGYFHQNADHTRLDGISYRHLRQGSSLGLDFNTNYKGRYNYTGNGLQVERNIVQPGRFIRFTGFANHLKYNEGQNTYTRVSGEGTVDIAQRKLSGWRYGGHAGINYVEQFRPALDLSGQLLSDSPTRFYQVSLGYSERVPTLHELYLPSQVSSFFGQAGDYIEYGNPNLKIEQQVVGSAEAELGTFEHRVNLSVTAGKLFYGIDWLAYRDSTTGTDVYTFTPINHDVTFANATVRGEWQFRSFLQAHGGASYRWQKYAGRDDWPYTPDYQFFTGGQLHYFWQQKLIDLWAYGEMVYVGPHDTYSGKTLGLTPVFNGKLSFQMGSFRFNLSYLNLLTSANEPRESLLSVGRTITWGFVWRFLD